MHPLPGDPVDKSQDMRAISATGCFDEIVVSTPQTEPPLLPDHRSLQDLDRQNERDDEPSEIEHQYKEAQRCVSARQQQLRAHEQAVNWARRIMTSYSVGGTPEGRTLVQEMLRTMSQRNNARTHELGKAFRSAIKDVVHLEEKQQPYIGGKGAKSIPKTLSRHSRREKNAVQTRTDAIIRPRAEVKEQDRRSKAMCQRGNRQISYAALLERDVYKANLARYNTARRFHNHELETSKHLLIMNGGRGIEKMCRHCLFHGRDPLHRPGSCTEVSERAFSRSSPLRNEVLQEAADLT